MEDLENFYDKYVDKVYKYFYINCFERSIAEDLTSQTFVAFIDKSKDLKIDDSKKYLYAIMRNTWMNYLRTKYKESLESLESISDFEVYAETQVQDYESKSIKDRAYMFIKQLPEKQGQVAKMRLIDEMTIREIAKKLGKNTGYVKTTQGRAIKNLKKMLESPELGGGLL